MRYFTWSLGLGLALAFGLINVLWLEASYAFGELDEAHTRDASNRAPTTRLGLRTPRSNSDGGGHASWHTDPMRCTE